MAKVITRKNNSYFKLPERIANGHKGTFGRLLVIGGNDGMIGAPAFAATSALRMGVGLVQVAAPKRILMAILSITPELIGMSLSPASMKKNANACEAADAIVIGPGLLPTPENTKHLLSALGLKKRLVIDAGALNILSQLAKWPKTFRAEAVLTPHPGEMLQLARLFGENKVPADNEGRMQIAEQAARAFEQTIVLKGARTVVTNGFLTYVNETGDSTLAKAGTGDVLSGMIGALLAQGLEPFSAACLAVRLHGRAGEIAGEAFGTRSALATDVILKIADALREHTLA